MAVIFTVALDSLLFDWMMLLLLLFSCNSRTYRSPSSKDEDFVTETRLVERHHSLSTIVVFLLLW